MKDRDGAPEPIGEALAEFLRARGLEDRVDRASILVEWAGVVGEQIARVTTPRQITEDGTLFVGVTTHAWMTELSLMESQLLEQINAREGRKPVKRIRWELRR